MKVQPKNRINVLHVIDKLSVSGSIVHGITKALQWGIPRFDTNLFRFGLCVLGKPEPAGKIFTDLGIKTEFIGKYKIDPRKLTGLLHIIKRDNVDVLHLHGYAAADFGRLAGIIKGVPTIVHEHVVFSHVPFYQVIADRLLSPWTTKAIAISRQVKDFMVSGRKINPDIIETIIYGIPLERFVLPNEKEIDAERKKLGIESDEKIVCNVGRLAEQKGQIHLLEAAKIVLEQFPKVRFIIVGEGPLREMLISHAKKIGVMDRVIFTGHREDVPVLVAMSDIIAIPSLFEGGPVTLFEAMNLGKPVIGTPVGVMGEMINDGHTGFVIPINSPGILADKIIYLLKNPKIAESMGKAGYRVCQEYDISKHCVNKITPIYRHLSGK